MLDPKDQGLIALVRSALGLEASLPEGVDLAELYEEAKRHAAVSLFYYGALGLGISPSEKVMQDAFRTTCALLSLSEKQNAAFEELFSALEQEAIPYLPLKGIGLKKLYPDPVLRSMSDGDILISEKDYPRIAPMMEALGYEKGVESDHEYVWHRGVVNLELHRRLIPSYNKDYYAYFGDGWNQAVKLSGQSRHEMTPEDEFVYLFVHFAKHYRDAGIGIRHVTDLYVFRRHHPEMDRASLMEKLRILGVCDFYLNMEKVLDVWFGNGSWDEVTEFISRYVLSSGVYGTYHTLLLSDALKKSKEAKGTKNAKRKFFWRMVFPRREDMAKHYPILKTWGILLPFCWALRLLTRLTGKGKWQYFNEKMDSLEEEKVDEYQQALDFVGLDFRF